MQKELELLKQYKYRITKHQYKTFKGQILSGDINGFRTGLFRLISRGNNEKKAYKMVWYSNNTNVAIYDSDNDIRK